MKFESVYNPLKNYFKILARGVRNWVASLNITANFDEKSEKAHIKKWDHI